MHPEWSTARSKVEGVVVVAMGPQYCWTKWG